MSYKWKTVKKTKEYKNPYMEITRHDVMRPDGKKGTQYVLSRINAGDFFSIIIPLTPQNETFLVGQYRYPVSFYSWEFPMGHADGKDFKETAAIELKEETGITAKKITKIGSFFTVPGHSNETATVFIATCLTHGESEPTETELLEVKKVPIKTIGDMIQKGIILDGPTIVAYHYLSKYLKI